ALECGGSPPLWTEEGGGKPPHSIETWEIDGRLITAGEFTIDGYLVSADAFFQVNRHLLGTLRRRVMELASRSRRIAIELYAGVGFFTLPLTDIFQRVIAVEGSSVSHRCGTINAPRAEWVHAPVERWVGSMPRADFVV